MNLWTEIVFVSQCATVSQSEERDKLLYFVGKAAKKSLEMTHAALLYLAARRKAALLSDSTIDPKKFLRQFQIFKGVEQQGEVYCLFLLLASFPNSLSHVISVTRVRVSRARDCITAKKCAYESKEGQEPNERESLLRNVKANVLRLRVEFLL